MHAALDPRAGDDRLLDLFLRLVETPSPGGGERAVADLIGDELRAAGLEVCEDDTAAATGAGSGNLIVRLEGEGRGTPVLIAAHMDTVAVDGPVRALVSAGVVRSAGDTILGADDKAACAALVDLLLALAGEPPACGLEAVFTTAEERGLRGAKALDVAALRARAGFVFDCVGPLGEVQVRAPGRRDVTATFRGVAAHAGIAPEKGRNAVAAAAHAVAAMPLGRIDDLTSANIGIIDGGTAINVVPDRCRIAGEARSHDGERLAAQVTAMLDAIQLGAALAGVDVETEVSDDFAAFALDDEALPVRIAVTALREVGVEPRLEASGGGSDVNVLNERGLASVNLSVGMEDVHSPHESMPVAGLHAGRELMAALLSVAARTPPE